jgi:hypothetical protein
MASFIFRNADTAETRQASAVSLNVAARSVGLDVPYRGKLPEPWQAIECRDEAGRILWRE